MLPIIIIGKYDGSGGVVQLSKVLNGIGREMIIEVFVDFNFRMTGTQVTNEATVFQLRHKVYRFQDLGFIICPKLILSAAAIFLPIVLTVK